MNITRGGTWVLFMLRIVTGMHFLIMGYTYFTTKGWSIVPLIQKSAFADGFYSLLTTPGISNIIDSWLPILLMTGGVLILLGLWMHIGIYITLATTVLFTLPTLPAQLSYPYAELFTHNTIIILCLLVLYFLHVDEHFGLGANVTIKR